MTQPTTTAALFAQNNSTTAELTDDDYIPAWSYITIVEKNIETQTMLVTQHPMF